MQKVVLITDTHYGCKGGSHNWFRYQSDFIYKQLIPELKNMEDVILIHLGDVFDSRSTLNTMIASEVRKMFIELASCVKDFYVIPGNHDYFSEQTSEYCTPELLLGNIVGLHLITETTTIQIGPTTCTLIPWHSQKDTPISIYTAEHPSEYIFTHSDIILGSPKLYGPVFSGHIHTPYINGNYRNLGSCYSLDFHDHNQQRYYYVWDPETDKLERFANEHSIRFWRWRDDEIINVDLDKMNRDDYIELYISASLMTCSDYQERLEEFKKRFKNIWVIPVPEQLIGESVDISCDIESIIEQSIPEELRAKFNYLKEKINGNPINK